MKKFILSILLFGFIAGLFVLTGCTRNAYSVTKPAGPYMVTLGINHNPPVAGPNDVTVDVKDSADKAVTDAKVVVKYDMPAMPGMPAMSHKTDTVLEGSRYKGSIDLMMAGPWNITVQVNRGGQTESARFTVDAR